MKLLACKIVKIAIYNDFLENFHNFLRKVIFNSISDSQNRRKNSLQN